MAGDIDGGVPPGGGAPPRPKAGRLQHPARTQTDPLQGAPRPARHRAGQPDGSHRAKAARGAGAPLSAAGQKQLEEHGADGTASAALAQSIEGASAKYVHNPHAITAEQQRSIAEDVSSVGNPPGSICLPGPAPHVQAADAALVRRRFGPDSLLRHLQGLSATSPSELTASLQQAWQGDSAPALSPGTVRALKTSLGPMTGRQAADFAALTGTAVQGAAQAASRGEGARLPRSLSLGLGQAAAESRGPLAAGPSDLALPATASPPQRGRNASDTAGGRAAPKLGAVGSLSALAGGLSAGVAAASAHSAVEAKVDAPEPATGSASSVDASGPFSTDTGVEAITPESAGAALALVRRRAQASRSGVPGVAIDSEFAIPAHLSWDAWAAFLQDFKQRNALLFLTLRQETEAFIAAAAIAAREVALAAKQQLTAAERLNSMFGLFYATKSLQVDLENTNVINFDRGTNLQTQEMEELNQFPKIAGAESRQRKALQTNVLSQLATAQATGPLALDHLLSGQGGRPAFVPTVLTPSELTLLRTDAGHRGLADTIDEKQRLIVSLQRNAVGNRFNTLVHEEAMRQTLVDHLEQRLQPGAAEPLRPGERRDAEQQVARLRAAIGDLRTMRAGCAAEFRQIALDNHREDLHNGSLTRLRDLDAQVKDLADRHRALKEQGMAAVAERTAGAEGGPRAAAQSAHAKELQAVRTGLLDELRQALALQAPLMLNVTSATDNRTGRHHSGGLAFRATVKELWDATDGVAPGGGRRPPQTAAEQARLATKMREVRLSATSSAFAAATLSHLYSRAYERSRTSGSLEAELAELRHGTSPESQRFREFAAQTCRAQLIRHVYDHKKVAVPGLLGVIKARPAGAQGEERARDEQELDFWRKLTFPDQREPGLAAWQTQGNPQHVFAVNLSLREFDATEKANKAAFLASHGGSLAATSPQHVEQQLERLAQDQLPAGLDKLDQDRCIEQMLDLYNNRSSVLNKNAITNKTYERLEQLNVVLGQTSLAGLMDSMSNLLQGTAEEAAGSLEQAFAEMLETMGGALDYANAMQRRLNDVFSITT